MPSCRVRRNEPLTVRQVEVLQWISEGCPDGVWRDFTYKTTAYALASRGLVTVDRRRKQWSAALTDEGHFTSRTVITRRRRAQSVAPLSPKPVRRQMVSPRNFSLSLLPATAGSRWLPRRRSSVRGIGGRSTA